MIDITRKSVAKLRGLISFYQRRNDQGAVRMIENEIHQRNHRPKRKRSKKRKREAVPLEGRPEPRDCVHDWIPLETAMPVRRYQCRVCEAIGWMDSFHIERMRVYTCQRENCHLPVQRINAVGERTCREHYREKPLKPRGL